MGYGEPQARSVFLGREERIKKTVDMERNDAVAVVDDLDNEPLIFTGCRQLNRASIRTGLNRVDHQVQQHLLQLLQVAFDRREFGIDMFREMDDLTADAVPGEYSGPRISDQAIS